MQIRASNYCTIFLNASCQFVGVRESNRINHLYFLSQKNNITVLPKFSHNDACLMIETRKKMNRQSNLQNQLMSARLQ